MISFLLCFFVNNVLNRKSQRKRGEQTTRIVYFLSVRVLEESFFYQAKQFHTIEKKNIVVAHIASKLKRMVVVVMAKTISWLSVRRLRESKISMNLSNLLYYGRLAEDR